MKMVEKRKALNEAIANGEKRRQISKMLEEYRATVKEEGFTFGFINNKEAVYKKEGESITVFNEETCEFNKL